MNNPPITTLYLIPHSHTDLGYTHDPVIAKELHSLFLDRAITLCEETADAPEHERFYWTIEVFCTLEHWWARRDVRNRDRLLALMRSGRIDLGLRYTNGTMLNGPVNIEWEIERAASFCQAHQLPCRSIFQNDVNGISIAYARRLAQCGVTGLVMGLNTTMGVSPLPRPGAFRWNVSKEQQLLVWHGWIYNRIGRFVHLNELEDKLEGAWPELIARLPVDYPFSFTMMSATINDNVGPFARLPRQVTGFNAKKTGLELRLTTITRFLSDLGRETRLPELSGDWNDVWNFGLGSMPQEVAMVRRAQRRLEVIKELRALALQPEPALAPLVEQAQHEVSMACEHTYESHTSVGDHTLGDDGKRQWVESQVAFAQAESFSMLALRLAHHRIAEGLKVAEPSVLAVNTTDYPLPFRVLWNRKLATNITSTEALEHLAQFDREPTIEGLSKTIDLGLPGVLLPPHSTQVIPLKELQELRLADAEDAEPAATISTPKLSVQIDAQGSPIIVQPDRNYPWVDAGSPWPFGIPVLERLDPKTPLQYKSEAERRDPSDAEWNPDLKFHREKIGCATRCLKKSNAYFQELAVSFADSPVRSVAYRIDALAPELLEIAVELRLDDSTGMRALYLPLTFNLPGNSEVRFRYDSCGDWIEAPDGQLPGAGTNVYASYRGVVMERERRTIYIIAPDAPLWQLGGFTFGHPHVRLDRSRATVHSWLYNNYWYTNFPSTAPGWFLLKYLVAFTESAFDPRYADELYHRFHLPYLYHPLWPRDPNRSHLQQ